MKTHFHVVHPVASQSTLFEAPLQVWGR